MKGVKSKKKDVSFMRDCKCFFMRVMFVTSTTLYNYLLKNMSKTIISGCTSMYWIMYLLCVTLIIFIVHFYLILLYKISICHCHFLIFSGHLPFFLHFLTLSQQLPDNQKKTD
jgi:hypothetical protein